MLINCHIGTGTLLLPSFARNLNHAILVDDHFLAGAEHCRPRESVEGGGGEGAALQQVDLVRPAQAGQLVEGGRPLPRHWTHARPVEARLREEA